MTNNNLPTIAGVEIHTDSQGRFNLNGLHKAHLALNPSLHPNSKQPADWIKLEGTKELMKIVSNSEDFTGAPIQAMSGRYGGTFAHELLAIEYAGWISPKFRLQVNQTFLNFKAGKLAIIDLHIPKTYSGALRLAADLEDKVEEQKVQIASDAPKVAVYDNHLNVDGLKPIRLAANDLGMRPMDFTNWLVSKGFIYKKPGNKNWLAYGRFVQQGLFVQKDHPYSGSDGYQKVNSRALLTQKGFIKFAGMLGKTSYLPPQAGEGATVGASMH